MLTAASANPLKNSIAHPWLPAAEEKKSWPIATARPCSVFLIKMATAEPKYNTKFESDPYARKRKNFMSIHRFAVLLQIGYCLFYIYTIKVKIIENNSHPKWTTLTLHKWPHTAGPKMVDKWKQLFLKYFHSKSQTFFTIAFLCTHRTHLLISYGKPIRGRMQITRPHVLAHVRLMFPNFQRMQITRPHVFKFPCMVISWVCLVP